MNRTLLISRLDLQADVDKKRKIFFTIGGINTPEVTNRLIKVLHSFDFIDTNEIVFKYNGIELNIVIQQVPDIIKKLCEEDISIYEVYQPYNPE